MSKGSCNIIKENGRNVNSASKLGIITCKSTSKPFFHILITLIYLWYYYKYINENGVTMDVPFMIKLILLLWLLTNTVAAYAVENHKGWPAEC